MRNSHRFVALLLTLILCLSTAGGAYASATENSVSLTALKFSPADKQFQITIEGVSQLTYNVYRPEPRLVIVDLPGADASKLQPSYAVNNPLVESIRVKQVKALSGKSLSRVEIALRADVQDRTRAVANKLIVDLFTVNSAMKPATVISRVSAKSEGGQTVAYVEADGALSYKTFSLHNPERVVLDVANVRANADRVIEVNSDKVERIRVGVQDTKGVRIVFDAKEPLAFQVSAVEKGLKVSFSSDTKSARSSQKPTQEARKEAKPDNKKVLPVNPPVAPPDNTGVSGGAGKPVVKAAVEKGEQVKEEAEARKESSVPSVKGPAVKPGLFKGAAARSVSAANSTAPQGSGLKYGDPMFVGEPISIDIAGIDINDILRFISDNYGENFILDKTVTGVNVTVKVNDVPWNQVLDAILKANQLSYTREGQIIRIATLSALAEEQEKQRRIEEEKINNLPKVSKFFRLKYTRLAGAAGGAQGGVAGSAGNIGGTTAGVGGATGIIGIVKKNLSKVGEVDSDPRTNQIIVTDVPQRVAVIEEIIKKLDVAEPQVEIEARVVAANRSFSRDIGNRITALAQQYKGPSNVLGLGGFINTSPIGISNPSTDGRPFTGNTGVGDGTVVQSFSSPQGLSGAANTVIGLTTGILGTSIISTAIHLAEQRGQTKTISNPRVTVQNNVPADITSGRQIPVQTEQNNTVTTQFVTAALRLNVTPQVVDENTVLLRIVVENNAVDTSIRTIGGTPSIATQRAETLVLVPDGGTTILGGVNIDVESTINDRTPGLANVPFLGELFKRRQNSRSTQELLFFVTPRIYRPETLGIQAAPPVPAAQPAEQVVPTSAGGER